MTRKKLAGVLLLSVLPILGAHTRADDDRAIDEWQRSQLFQPSDRLIQKERQGRVFIYEEMLESDIEKAMDTQFNRIEHMMFIRTIPTDKEGKPARDEQTGELVFADDGC